MKGEKMDRKEIGNRLKALRGKKSQEEVAKELEISVSSYQKYELGIRIPRDEIKIKIANLYKKSVQSIFFAQ